MRPAAMPIAKPAMITTHITPPDQFPLSAERARVDRWRRQTTVPAASLSVPRSGQAGTPNVRLFDWSSGKEIRQGVS
jgi:hypothetical protein